MLWCRCLMAWAAPTMPWDPDYFRSRADLARLKADKITDPDCRRLMLSVAHKWDELARAALGGSGPPAGPEEN
jgi:hypothetical protein